MTGLRGAAAVYVVLHHYFIGLSFTNPFKTFLAHGYLAVDLFFVLSGFVMTLNYAHMFRAGWSRTAMFKFLSRRIARVYPLYLVATTCALLLILAGWLENPAATSLKISLALNLAMVQAWGFGPSLDAPGWSISAEWAAYLLFPLLLAFAFFSKPRWGWLSATSSVAMLVVLAILPASVEHNVRPQAILDLHNAYRGFAVWRCLPEFTLGILAARLLGSAAAVWTAEHRWGPLGLCLCVLAMLAVPRADLGVVLLCPFLILGVAMEGNLPSQILGSRPFHYLGVLSYSMYLVHDLLGGTLARTHEYAHAHGLKHAQTYAAALGIFLTLPISAGAYKWIEAPGRRFVRGLFEERYSPRIQPQRAAAVDSRAGQLETKVLAKRA